MRLKRFQVQEYLFEWYNLDNMVFNTVQEAKEAMQSRAAKIERSNKRIRKQDFNMNGYGVEADYPTRIIKVA